MNTKLFSKQITGAPTSGLVFLLFAFLFASCAPASDPSETISEAVRNNARNRSVSIHYKISDYTKGSGVILNQKGYVLTALHVIRGHENELRVSTDGKKFQDAILIKQEPKFDLALLQIKGAKSPANLKSIRFANRSNIKINDKVFLFGAPYGLSQSFLKGYVSHTNRVDTDVTFPKIPFIQTQGLSFPGCSGAGVYLADGRLAGLNRSTFGYTAGGGIGLTIPMGFIRVFLKGTPAQIN